MKKWIKHTLLFLLVLPFFIRPVQAFHGDYVTDDDHRVLDQQQINELNQKAQNLAQDSGLHVIIAVDSYGDMKKVSDDLYNTQAESNEDVLIWAMDQEALYAYGYGPHASSFFTNDVLSDIYQKAESEADPYSFFDTLLSQSNQVFQTQTTPSSTLYEESDHAVRLVDQASLLTETEQTALTAKLDEISQRQQMDIVIVTVPSLQGKDVVSYADDYYDYHNYGYTSAHDGLLLLLAMAERDWAISTCGAAIPAFTDAAQNRISNAILDDLSDGYYYDAFDSFADQCDRQITAYYNSINPELQEENRRNTLLGGGTISAPVIAAIVALLRTSKEKRKLKSVHRQSEAASYIAEGSFNLTDRRDYYLFSHRSRVKRPEQNRNSGGGSSTHISRSGRTHGGSRGKF